MMKITHPCAVTAQTGKGLVLSLTINYNKKKENYLWLLNLIRFNNQWDVKMLNHIECKMHSLAAHTEGNKYDQNVYKIR